MRLIDYLRRPDPDKAAKRARRRAEAAKRRRLADEYNGRKATIYARTAAAGGR